MTIRQFSIGPAMASTPDSRLRQAVYALLLWALFMASEIAIAATYQIRTEPGTPFETATTNVVWELSDTGYPVDDDRQLVSIGFTFNFGGIDYTQVRVMSNGVLHFGANQGFHKYYVNEALPITGAYNGPGFEEPADRVIAGYWDDLEPSSGGTVRYSTLGSAPNRRFVASWENIAHYPNTGNYSLQIVIYENGEIRFRYGAGDANGASATIGVEVDDTDYTQHSYNSAGAVSSANDLVFYIPPHFGIAHGGTGSTCSTEDVTITRYNGIATVDTTYTGTITLSTSTGNGDWRLVTGNGVLVNSGSGNGSYTYDAGDAGVVVLGLTNPNPETLNIDVTDGTYAESASLDPDLTFAAGGPTETFRDEFGAVAYGNNDGSLNWTGPWVEGGDDGNPAGGNVLITGGALNLDDRPNTGGQPRLEREADLSTFLNASLSFDFQTTGGVDNSDAITLETSANGGGSWSTLETFTGISGTTSGSRTYDISGSMSSNTRVRFRVSNLYGGNNERFIVDDVEIMGAGPCAGADHFVIAHDGYGINCLAETVSVTPIDIAGSPLTGYTETIVLDTQIGTGSWTGTSGDGSLVDGSPGAGQATYTFSGTETLPVDFSLVFTGGTASLDIEAYQQGDPSIRDDDSEPALVFSPNGFTVTPTPLANPPGSIDPIPSQTAGTPFNLYLTAYGQTPADPTCGVIEDYAGVKALEFWSAYADPATGSRQVTLGGTPVGTSEAAATLLNVNFVLGQTAVPLAAKYKDVGLIRIAMKDGSVADPSLPNGIRGATNLFVVKPARFALSNIRRTADGFPNPGTAVDATGDKFNQAGEPFTVTVTALDAEDSATPNFGQESSPEGVGLGHNLVAPAAGFDPALQYSTGFGGFSGGSATGTDFSWDEVGIIALVPSIADGNYLGAGDVTGATSVNVGRFYPYDFAVTVDNVPELTPGCGAFTYLDQPFDYATAPSVTITARNRSAATTRNYAGTWWRLPDIVASHGDAGPLPPGVNLDDSAAGHAPSTDAATGNGTVTTVFSGPLTYQRPLAADAAPFTAGLIIAFDVLDTDGAGYDDGGGGNTFSFSVPFTGGQAEQRHGRLTGRSAGGSELLPVSPPLFVEYFNGTGFLDNTADGCTQLDLATHLALSNPETAGGAPQIGTTAMSIDPAGNSSAVLGGPSFTAGQSGLAFSAPGPGNTGHIDIDVTIGALAGTPYWLQYNWSGTAPSHTEDPPRFRATFGIFGGSSSIINIIEPVF